MAFTAAGIGRAVIGRPRQPPVGLAPPVIAGAATRLKKRPGSPLTPSAPVVKPKTGNAHAIR